MKIYVEDAIVVNFILNISLMLTISNCLRLNISKPKLILSSILASTLSLTFNLAYVNIHLKYLLDILISLFILSFSFKNLNIKKFCQATILLSTLTNLYAGLLQNFGYNFDFGVIIDSLLPSVICLAIISISTILIAKLLRKICQRQKLHSNIYKVQIDFNGKTISTFGYFDTGNNLSHNTNPVSIVNYKLFENLTNIKLTNLLSKNFDLKDAQYIKTSTLTGTKNLLMFTIDKMTILKEKKQETIMQPKFALSLNLQNNKEYDIILNNNYM